MRHSGRLRRLTEILYRTYGGSWDSQSEESVLVRAAVAATAKENGWGITAIGRAMEKNHSTITNAMRKQHQYVRIAGYQAMLVHAKMLYTGYMGNDTAYLEQRIADLEDELSIYKEMYHAR